MRSKELRAAARRVGAIRSIGLLAFLALAGRAAHLSVIETQGHALGERQIHSRIELPPARGVIYDRRGVELAVTTNSPSVYAMASEIDGRASASLARALGVSRRTLDARLAKRSGFTYLARWVSAEQADRVAKLGLPGVGLIAEPRRAYPAGSLAGRLLGFADIDGKGVRGIEQLEDRWLSGKRMVIPVERDGGGQLLAKAPLRPADAAGGDIALTLDASLQAEAESALLAAIKATRAKGGVIVTLDPESSDVLALAEAPTLDPNRFRSTPYKSTGSAAFLSAQEPGSTLKVFLAALALEEEALSRHELLATGEGQIQVPGKLIRDRRNFGPLDLGGMLRLSSNVGAVLAAQALGPQAHYEGLLRFGFGKRSGSRFPSESAGLIRPWQRWQPLDHATVAYGHGINTTPIQLAAAMAALANGGEWRSPRLIQARRLPGENWKHTEPGAPRRAVSSAVARQTLDMMQDVVSADGTGRNAGLAGVQVAGKTGTAQKLDPKTKRYAKDRYISWFIGAVPAEDPKLAIVVALDEAQTEHSGGLVAAPLFASVAASQLAHLGIITHPEPIRPEPSAAAEPPIQLAKVNASADAAQREVKPASQRVALKAPPAKAKALVATPAVAAPPPVAAAPRRQLSIERIGDRVLVPDFRGYSLAEVRQITAAHALELKASGSGRAVSQEPAPGTILAGGERGVRVRFAAESESPGGNG